jgi:hypothetical protein
MSADRPSAANGRPNVSRERSSPGGHNVILLRPLLEARRASRLRGRAGEATRRPFPAQPALQVDIGGLTDSVESPALPHALQRAEGIAYSSRGDVLAVATSEADTVFLFRRKPDGQFETTPYSSISGPESKLAYPHDIAFTPSPGGELMAVAQRGGAITFYQRDESRGTYGPTPVFELRGPATRLSYSDALAFVPPDHGHLAVCNLQSNTVSFYRRSAGPAVRFELEPICELQHESIVQPDGLAFSRCGRWLAICNHGKHTVSIFRRRSRLFSWGKLRYGPRPVTVIKDPSLRFPHSAAFSPETDHLIVTNAGANYFSIYAPTGHGRARRWSQTPVAKTIVGADRVFKKINVANKREGGPKGIAIHRGGLAVCSPGHGIKIYSLREHAPASE